MDTYLVTVTVEAADEKLVRWAEAAMLAAVHPAPFAKHVNVKITVTRTVYD